MVNLTKTFKFEGNKLIFEFDSSEAANFFKTWLCEGGEQDFWVWEEQHMGTITNFDYWAGSTIQASTSESEELMADEEDENG